MDKWECFCDESYYGKWAVRPVGENRWGHCFHLERDEAKGLCKILNELEAKLEAKSEIVVSETK